MHNFIDDKLFFDDYTSLGLSKEGHLIINQEIVNKVSKFVVLYKEILPNIKAAIETATLDKGKKTRQIFEKSEYGVLTQIFLNKQKEEIVISQNAGADLVVLGQKLLLEILSELSNKV